MTSVPVPPVPPVPRGSAPHGLAEAVAQLRRADACRPFEKEYIHRHRDITDGLDALAVAMRSSTAVSAEETCVAAQAMLPGSTPRANDVCLLAARLTG